MSANKPVDPPDIERLIERARSIRAHYMGDTLKLVMWSAGSVALVCWRNLVLSAAVVATHWHRRVRWRVRKGIESAR
jgi:hypothetical protein